MVMYTFNYDENNEHKFILNNEEFKVKVFTSPIAGPQGETGASIIEAEFSGDDILFTKDDDSTVTLTDAKTTLTGPQGIQGPQGPQGPQGIQGEIGETGASIITAEFSGDDILFTKDDASTVTLTDAKITLTGPQGETGETGASIISAEFSDNDIVFTKDDATTVQLTDAKITLTGPQGETGEGVIAGGTTAQVLAKASNDDYDTEWVNRELPLTFLAGLIRADNTITTNDSEIDHNSLLNYTIDEHRTINDLSVAETDLWSASKINSELALKDNILTFSTGLTRTENTITTNDSEINHDSLNNYVPNEHIDWSISQALDIHPDNYIDTTYTSSDFTHNDLTGLNEGATYQHITSTQETNFETAYSHSQVVLGNPHNVTLSDVGGTTDHTELSNIGSNTHAQIDTHIGTSNIHKDHSLINVTAGSGLSGGGNITDSITLNIDITELDAITSIDDTNPLLVYQAGNKKITFGDFKDNIEITANQVSDFDVEVSNNTDVSLNTTHRTSDGTDHSYIDQDVTTTATPTHSAMKFTPQTAPSHEEGLVYYDSTKKALTYYNEETSVAMNLGQEFFVRVYNDTGSTISNGKACYISGVESNFPKIRLADAKYYDKTRIIGIATHDIETGTYGYVTRIGVVGELDTSAFAAQDCLYLDCDTPGDLTTSEPVDSCFEVYIGKVLVADATNGAIYIDPNISDKTRETNDTNGFPSSQRTATTISFVEGTRTFTITPTGDEFYYYIYGVKYIKNTAESIVIDNTTGEHLVYYDGTTLSVIANPTNAQVDNIIRNEALVSYLYWNATTSELLYLGDERHGIFMSPNTHAYLHFTEGARYLSGLALNSIVADEDGSLDSHAQFGTDLGMITDEDLIHMLSAVDSTTGLSIWYRTGAGGLWRKTTNSGFSVLTTGTGRLAYNLDTAGTWSLAEVPNGNYVNYFVFATNDINKVPISVPGIAYYTSIEDAQSGANDEANIIINTLATPEFRLVGSVIFQTGNTAGSNYSNAVKAKIVSTTEGYDYIDWRTTATTPGGGVGSHSSLSGLSENNVHPSSSISNVTTNFDNILSSADTDVLSALETIDNMTLGDISNVDDAAITDGQILKYNIATGNYEPYTLTGGSDEKVSIDASATPGYIGATGSDGVLRVGSLLSYTDGGDYITLNVNESSLDHNNLTNTHNLTTDIDHNSLTNYDIAQHRTINDAGTAVTDLWSASKITTELGDKADLSDLTTHTGDSTIHFTQATISITALQVSDFDTEVSNNTDVSNNTSFRTTPSSVITAGSNIAWSGNTLNVTPVLDINGLSAITSLQSTDELAIYDSSITANRKVTFGNFETNLNHNSLLNTHNLTTDIDHNSLTNYDIAQHRVINDSATTTTNLWSGSKINSELSGKANTGDLHDAVTVTDSTEIDFTLTGQDITASLKSGSIDVLKLDSGVQTSLGKADSAIQANTSPQFANLYVSDYLYHYGDTNTFIYFATDRVQMSAGGVSFLDAIEATNDDLYLGLSFDRIFLGTNNSTRATITDSGLQIGGGATVNTINTTFVDNDTSLMTSQAIKEKIENYGYITGISAINNIGDVTISTPSNNELLAYDTTSGNWTNQTPSEAGFATVATTGSYNDLSDKPTDVTNMSLYSTTNLSEGTNLYYTEARVSANSDVSSNTSFRTTPSSVITAGTNIAWDGNTLNVSVPEINSIGDIADVDTIGIANGKILKYNSISENWEIADDNNTTYTSSDFDHNSLTNTHNLTTDINHNSLTNYSIDEHRTINDSGTATTDLWSGSKINTELGNKASSTHVHGEITNAGAVTTNVIVANTDRILISDASDSSKVKGGAQFGTSTSTFLRNDGTWAEPAGGIEGSGVSKITVGTSTPTSPSTGDLWVDTN